VGFWCNDDTVELNPALMGQWAPGRYLIYVGTYSPGGAPVPYTLQVSQQPQSVIPREPVAGGGGGGNTNPGVDISGYSSTYGALSFYTGAAPQASSGNAGGYIDASLIGVTPSGGCAGWIDYAPSHLLTLSAPASYLRIDAQAADDLVLVVYGPDGWRCNDDFSGYNPRVDGAFAAGVHSIWVGTYAGSVGIPYTLSIADTY
jgi:hypothetical protein